MSLGINNERAETRKCRIYCKSVDRKESVQWVSYKYRFFFFVFLLEKGRRLTVQIRWLLHVPLDQHYACFFVRTDSKCVLWFWSQ